MTPVKDQSPKAEEEIYCGSCWAFAAVGAIEAANFLKYGVLRRYSEQQMVDCPGMYRQNGCDGGNPKTAMRYALRWTLLPEEEYPYVGEQMECKWGQGENPPDPKWCAE